MYTFILYEELNNEVQEKLCVLTLNNGKVELYVSDIYGTDI